MNKTMLFAAAASALALAAMPAAAAEFYGQGSAGVAFGSADASVDDGVVVMSGDLDLSTGYLISGAAGTRIKPNLRVEGEMAYTSNDVEDGDDLNVHQIALLGNVLYDFNPEAKMSPYVGAGLGFGRTFVEVDEGSDNDTGLAWQLRAGVTVKQDTMVWDIGYRYLQMAPYSASDGTTSVDVDAYVHALTVGLRFGG